MKARFAYPEPRDLKFERTEPTHLRRLPFPTDDVTRGDRAANIVACLVLAALLVLPFVKG